MFSLFIQFHNKSQKNVLPSVPNMHSIQHFQMLNNVCLSIKRKNWFSSRFFSQPMSILQLTRSLKVVTGWNFWQYKYIFSIIYILYCFYGSFVVWKLVKRKPHRKYCNALKIFPPCIFLAIFFSLKCNGEKLQGLFFGAQT